MLNKNEKTIKLNRPPYNQPNTFSYGGSVLKGDNIFAKNVQKSAVSFAAMAHLAE
jgi:hypothetical protein